MERRGPAPDYFLVAVSNRQNLDLCLKYALAGFPNSGAGIWTFCDIHQGDYISFLYGARAYNLYQVVTKEAIREFESLPPWPPLKFRESGRTYHFPFRLRLEVRRELTESLVRPEFAYVAENLLLRAGYRRTHFQADQTTLQSVSQMGRPAATNNCAYLELPEHSTFAPQFTNDRSRVQPPFVNLLSEMVLQSAIRHHLKTTDALGRILDRLGLDRESADEFEVLGEKALPQGHVDILIKDRVPIAKARKIVLEVKLSAGSRRDIDQLKDYVRELGPECIGGVLIAKDFSLQSKRYARSAGLHLATYDLQLERHVVTTFEEITDSISLTLF
jgi:hypothetical protein